MEQFFDIISDITIYSSVFLSIIFLIGFAKFGKAYKFFSLYLVSIAIIQMIMKLWKYYYEGESNLFLFFYFFTLQFIWLSLFYWKLLNAKSVIIILFIVLFFVGFQYYLNPLLYLRYNPIGITVTQLFLILYSLVYLYRNLTHKGQFYLVNIGVCFYFLSSTLIFASGNLSLDDKFADTLSSILVKVNVIVFLIFQILIFVEWWNHFLILKRKSST